MSEAAPARRPARKGWTAPKVPLLVVYAVGFVPAAYYIVMGVMDRLGADPVKALEHALGLWALRLLIATLAVTPLRQLFSINVLRYRRQLGLLAFFYAALHLAAYFLLDQSLDLEVVIADIVKRPFITIGMAAFVLLVPLAVTSNNASIRKMGAQGWARLHRLVYPVAALVAVHFIMSVKSWPMEPLVYAAIVAALLLYRVARAINPPAAKRPARA